MWNLVTDGANITLAIRNGDSRLVLTKDAARKLADDLKAAAGGKVDDEKLADDLKAAAGGKVDDGKKKDK